MKRRWIAGACALCLLVRASTAFGEPGPPADALGAWTRFYAGFEDRLPADFAAGAAAPVRSQGPAVFEAGHPGRALRVGVAGGGAQVEYALDRNLDLQRPGALSFWVSPRSWRDQTPPGDSGYVPFVRLAGRGSSAFIVERDVRSDAQDRLLAGFFGLPGGEQYFLQLPLGSRWQSGSWHLVALSWDSGGFAVSVDGGPLVRRAVPDGRRTPFAPVPGAVWLVGAAATQEASLIDELRVYARSLEDEDAAQLWRAGMPGGAGR